MDVRNPWRELARQPPGMWIVFIATLVNRSGSMALPYLVLYLTQKQGRSPSEAGLVMAVYGLGSFVAGPLAGAFSDRVGPLRVIQGSLIGSGLMLAAFPWIRSYSVVLPFALCWALIGEAYRPASAAFVSAAVAPHERKTAFALYRLASNLGFSIGPVLGGLLVTRVSYAALFWIDGLTSVMAGCVWAVAYRREKSHASLESNRPGEPHSFSQRADAAPTAAARAVWLDFRLMYFMFSFLPASIVFFQFEGALPLFVVRELHLSEFAYGSMFLINTLMIITLEVPLNVMMERWTYRQSLTFGALLTAIGWGSLTFAGGAWGVAMSIVIWTFGEMILMPASAAYVAEIAPAHRQGAYMGAYHMTFSTAFALGPWIGAVLLDNFGGSVVWAMAFIAGAVSAALLYQVSAVSGDRSTVLAAPPRQDATSDP